MNSKTLAAAAFLLALPTAASAQDLPRRAFLGVSMPPAAQQPAQGEGVVVGEVLPGGTATRIGVRSGDVIVGVGSERAGAAADVIRYAEGLVEGAPVALRVRRDGRELRLQGPAAGRPRETHEGGTIDYGAVPWRGGHLRDLLLMPERQPQAPVIFLIQGFSCASIESPDPQHAYRRLGSELVARGIGYYRVEKPALGDSRGTPRCEEIDYTTELDAFRAAYRHLIAARGVPADRIFMFGHSLGGMQAPMLAAETAPRGVAAYGTVLRNWADYHFDVIYRQGIIMRGADPVENVTEAERVREPFRRFYAEGRSPAEAAAGLSEADAALFRGAMNWDGGERVLGRHYVYDQQLAGLPLVQAWRDARTNVLSIYGESDKIALNDEDHRLIVDVVNHYRPGTARYVEIAGTGHGFERIGPPAEARERFRTTNQPPEGPFNPEVADRLAEWVREAMARPPVAAG